MERGARGRLTPFPPDGENVARSPCASRPKSRPADGWPRNAPAGAVLSPQDLRFCGAPSSLQAPDPLLCPDGQGSLPSLLVLSPPRGARRGPRRPRKHRIPCFALTGKARSLRCSSSPHKIFDFAGHPSSSQAPDPSPRPDGQGSLPSQLVLSPQNL